MSPFSLTYGHHVVPSVQQTHAELEPLRSESCCDEGAAQLRVLTHSRGPRRQEPEDDQQDDQQQPQDPPAGHVRGPLGGAGQEHLQHPERGMTGD